MTVICNVTPLINFAAINRLDILQATFGQIIIPQAVFHETTGTDFPSSNFVQQAIAANWLEVRTVSSTGANISPELHAGEREAIAYNAICPAPSTTPLPNLTLALLILHLGWRHWFLRSQPSRLQHLSQLS